MKEDRWFKIEHGIIVVQTFTCLLKARGPAQALRRYEGDEHELFFQKNSETVLRRERPEASLVAYKVEEP